jgi:hypothetical protein
VRRSFEGLAYSGAPRQATSLRFSGGGTVADIGFDGDLLAGTLNPGEWIIVCSNRLWLSYNVVAADDAVTITKASDAPYTAADSVTYTKAVGDLKGDDGQPVDAFSISP